MRIGDRGSSAIFARPSGYSRDVRESKKERWKFHMSMKFENTEVRAGRSSSGLSVSRVSRIGVRKC